MRNSLARTVTVIADSGGGITLQITDRLGRRYQHDYYGSGAALQLAGDLRSAYDDSLCLPVWEGNEVEEHGWCDPTDDEQRNGGYRVYGGREVLRMDNAEEAWGAAMGDLIDAMLKIERIESEYGPAQSHA